MGGGGSLARNSYEKVQVELLKTLIGSLSSDSIMIKTLCRLGVGSSIISFNSYMMAKLKFAVK